MRLAEGRFFTAADTRDAEQVIIVNEAFVAAYMGGGSALDKPLRFAFRDSVPWQRVVGVVKNARHNGITGDIKHWQPLRSHRSASNSQAWTRQQ